MYLLVKYIFLYSSFLGMSINCLKTTIFFIDCSLFLLDIFVPNEFKKIYVKQDGKKNAGKGKMSRDLKVFA